jgi:hypothetical protein
MPGIGMRRSIGQRRCASRFKATKRSRRTRPNVPVHRHDSQVLTNVKRFRIFQEGQVIV